MKIAIIEAEGIFAVYFDGRKKFQNSYLEVEQILRKIIEHAKEFNIIPSIDSYVHFYCVSSIEKAEGIFPELIHEAIKLYGLV